MRPSRQLHGVISGTIAPKECTQAVQSWLRFPVYLRAVSVLKLPFDQRREALDKVPDTWRGMVEAECVRVNKLGVKNEKL